MHGMHELDYLSARRDCVQYKTLMDAGNRGGIGIGREDVVSMRQWWLAY